MPSLLQLRGQRARMCALIDRSTRLAEPPLVLQALLAPLRRLPLTTLSRESCLCTWRLTCLWTDVRIFLYLCTAPDGRLALVCIGLTAVAPENAKLCPAYYSCELLRRVLPRSELPVSSLLLTLLSCASTLFIKSFAHYYQPFGSWDRASA